MGKKSKILDCNVFLADVLGSLKRWGEEANTHATELMAPMAIYGGTHILRMVHRMTGASSDVVASSDDPNQDAHDIVLELLKGCCEAGIILWRRHCSEHLEPNDTAKAPTEAEKFRASMCDANNDVCESNLSLAI
jgi:hypothetical protein